MEKLLRVILLSTGQTVLGARRLERLQALAEELSFGQSAVQTDVTQYAQVKHLVNHAVHPMQRRRIWDRMIDVNLKGVLYGIAAALPYMKAQKGGHTVISPGAVATELPDSITEPDIAENIRKRYEIAIRHIDVIINNAGLMPQSPLERAPADSFANMVVSAMSQPEDVDVNEILFRPDPAGILSQQQNPREERGAQNWHIGSSVWEIGSQNKAINGRNSENGPQKMWLTALRQRISRVFYRHCTY